MFGFMALSILTLTLYLAFTNGVKLKPLRITVNI